MRMFPEINIPCVHTCEAEADTVYEFTPCEVKSEPDQLDERCVMDPYM